MNDYCTKCNQLLDWDYGKCPDCEKDELRRHAALDNASLDDMLAEQRERRERFNTRFNPDPQGYP